VQVHFCSDAAYPKTLALNENEQFIPSVLPFVSNYPKNLWPYFMIAQRRQLGRYSFFYKMGDDAC